jgi:hypothetical protein
MLEGALKVENEAVGKQRLDDLKKVGIKADSF